MIKAIIFDCYGVLAGEGLVPFRQRHFGHDPKMLTASKVLSRKMVKGELSFDDLLIKLAEMAGKTYEQTVVEISTLSSKKNIELLGFIKKELKNKYKIGVLSNTAFGQLETVFSPQDLKLFDTRTLSFEVGFTKPNVKIYELAAKSLNVMPGECIFIDDNDRNILAAHNAGMLPIKYVSFNQFKRDLKRALADPAGSPNTVLEHVIKKYGDKPYKIVDHGYQNLVAIIDNQYVARIPRDHRAAKILARESEIITLLKDLDDPPLKTQKIIEFSMSPTYMVCDFIAGESMLENDIPGLPEPTQKEIGRTVARFINWLGQISSPQVLKKVAASVPDSLAWDYYLEQTIGAFDETDYPTLSAHAKRLSAQLGNFYPDGVNVIANQILHDDLYAGNIIFDESYSPIGVIDFSDMGVGDAEREMRQMYRTGQVVFDACVDEYESLSGKKIDKQRVKFWAEAQVFAALCGKIDKKTHPSFKRGMRNVKKWYPNEDWSELISDKVSVGRK